MGGFLAFFENIFVPEGWILMRTKNVNSSGRAILPIPALDFQNRIDKIGINWH